MHSLKLDKKVLKGVISTKTSICPFATSDSNLVQTKILTFKLTSNLNLTQTLT